MRLKSGLVLFFILLVPAWSLAQAWSGIIDPSRATDWTQAGIPGGVPNRTTICQTVAPSGSTDDTDSTDIDNALIACAGTNQVVQLEVGTYTLAKGIAFDTYNQYGTPSPLNNVTLRGAGPDKTILKFTGLASCAHGSDVCMIGNLGWQVNYAGSHKWTGGYAQGSTVLTLDSTSGLNAGQLIVLDQRNDDIGIIASPNGASESGSIVTITTSIPHGYNVGACVAVGGVGVAGYDGWFRITAMPTPTTFQYSDSAAGRCAGNSPGASGLPASGGGYATMDTGGLIVSGNPGPILGEYATDGRTCPDANDPQCAPGEVSERSQMEFKMITGISGNQITVESPLVMPNWRSSQAPGIWWSGSKIATLDGIEDLTLDMTNDGGEDSDGIEMINAYECWVKDVRSINGSRDHVSISQSAHSKVSDSYFFGTKSGAQKSYGIQVVDDSNILVQNNICQHVVGCIVNGSDGGAFAYNYMVDSGYGSAGWLIGMLVANHDFGAYDLFEGNDADASYADNVHGTSSADTWFRNRLRGQDTPAKFNDRYALDDSAFNRAENVIGNVLGTAGTQTKYETTTAYNPDGSVYSFGVPNEGAAVPDDSIAVSSALRWGNYDVVTGAVRRCGDASSAGWTTICASASEIPTSPFAFINANPLPSTTALPASFYLASQPAFWQTPWATPPWPAIGPDVTGGTALDGADGFSYAIPAELCYLNTPIDPAYQQSFAATSASWSTSTNPPSVTLTIGSNALVVGDTVTVSGVNPSGYNGVFTVSSETSTTISYQSTANPGPYVSGGTVSFPTIRLFSAAACYPKDFASGGPPAPPSGLRGIAH